MMLWLGLVAAGSAFLGAWRPLWGVALIVIGSPAYQLRIEAFGVPTTYLEAAIAGVILGYALRSGWRMIKGEPVFRQHWADVWRTVPAAAAIGLGLAMTGWMVATAISIDPRSSLGALKAWLIEPLLLGLIVLHESRPTAARVFLERALLVLLAWVSLAGFIQLAGFRETIEGGRMSSVFAPVANYFAMLAAPLLVLAYGLFELGRNRRFVGTILAIGLLALTLSVSFGGLLAFAAGALMIVLNVFPAQRRKRALLGCFVAGAILFIALLPTRYVQEKINFSTRSSSLVRIEIWKTAIAIGRDHPVFGIGPGTFELAYRETAPIALGQAPLEWLVAKPHNLYLNLWIETGLLGLVGMLIFFGSSLRRMFRGRTMSSVFAASLVAMLAHGLVDTTFFKNDLAVISAVIVALGLVYVRNESQPKN